MFYFNVCKLSIFSNLYNLLCDKNIFKGLSNSIYDLNAVHNHLAVTVS